MSDFRNAANEIYENADLVKHPSRDELREMAKPFETTTKYGSPMYVSKIRSRSAKFTTIIYKREPTDEEKETIRKAVEYLTKQKVLLIETGMCQKDDERINCRLLMSAKYPQIPLIWQETQFAPVEGRSEPDLVTVCIPEWPERRMLIDSESFTTFLLGSDYVGEVKKSFLRMTMYWAKKKGGLGLHAGSKILKLRDKDGKLVEKGAIFFGLSGTGKTTLTCHDHFLTGDEGVVIKQDDVLSMRPDAYCVGTENNFYIKTEGLEPVGQKVLYDTAVSPKALLENICVDKETGEIDFFNDTLTSNGRAVIYRSDLKGTDDGIDLPRADIVVFITRRKDVVPPVAKLTYEQAAAFFVLGESIETSAGDPAKAGQSKRVVGTNPFIIGPEGEEGNLFLKILRNNPGIECFLINTGRIGGKDGEKVTIKDSTEIIKQIARGGIDWEEDPFWGYQVATRVDGIDVGRLDPKKFYSEEEIREINEKLKGERIEWLAQFPELDPEIPKSIGCEKKTPQ